MTKKKGDEIATPRDPLSDLFKRVAKSTAEVFEPATVMALAALKQRDRQGFEVVRARLKTTKGVRIGELDDVIARENGETPRAFTQADILVQKADAAEYFRTPDHVAYADVTVGDHRETYPIRSRQFRRWLSRLYYETTGGSAPNNDTIQTALGVIEAKAQIEGVQREVFVRIGSHLGVTYVDLCNDKWEVVAISKTGWQVTSSPPIRFRRAPGMLPLPAPVGGGSINSLRRFLNLKNDRDFVLVVAWILAALRGEGPYPVLALAGEQGSAKSTTTKAVRNILDPNVASLRATPREERDLFIGANNAFVLAFDNVSGLPLWISDALCRISTGGGFSSRQLFTDDEEIMFNLMRPQILNGIEDVVTRPDLADRSLLHTLDPIPEHKRRTEAQMWADFDIERPAIMGAIYDAVSQGLIALPGTHLTRMPRMADFALWIVACEPALWPVGTFLRAYEENRAEAVEQIIEASAVASAIRRLMSNRLEWLSSSSDLLTKLTELTDQHTAKSRSWPKASNALSGRLRRVSATLRRIGIEIEFLREHGGLRKIRIFQDRQGADGGPRGIPQTPEGGKSSSPSSPSSLFNGSNGLGGDDHESGIVTSRHPDRHHGDPLDALDAPGDDLGGAGDDHGIEDRHH